MSEAEEIANNISLLLILPFLVIIWIISFTFNIMYLYSLEDEDYFYINILVLVIFQSSMLVTLIAYVIKFNKT